jgi:hypothetical protein
MPMTGRGPTSHINSTGVFDLAQADRLRQARRQPLTTPRGLPASPQPRIGGKIAQRQEM